MHRSKVEAVLEYEVVEPTHFCFSIEAARTTTQAIHAERLALSSGVAPHAFEDLNGNRCIRFDALPGPLMVNYHAELEVFSEGVAQDLPEVPVRELPDEVFRYLLPTRYCESDVLAATAQKMFGHLPPGLARVRAVVDWIHDEITYRPGSTGPMTTAQEVYIQRAGVCRDFAHLGITFCRALCIPARIVVGYVWFDEPPQDFHAVFEAWLGGRWVMFDPTRMAPVERLARIATGSDAKDVAFCTYYGNARLTRMVVDVKEQSPPPAPEEKMAPAAPVPQALPA
jgi:transglutaminase-like putative cysteine protease